MKKKTECINRMYSVLKIIVILKPVLKIILIFLIFYWLYLSVSYSWKTTLIQVFIIIFQGFLEENIPNMKSE